MLFSISSATSVNNNYTATLTQPGVYYFSCPVRRSLQRLCLQRLCSYHSPCSNACGSVCDLCCAPQVFTAICYVVAQHVLSEIRLLSSCLRGMWRNWLLTDDLVWLTAGDWSLRIWTVADRNSFWPSARHCIWYHLCNVKPQTHLAVMRDHVADNTGHANCWTYEQHARVPGAAQQ